jgi:hypothetical protein
LYHHSLVFLHFYLYFLEIVQKIVSTGIVPIIGLDFWTQNLVVPFNLSFDYAPSVYYDRNTTAKKNDFTINYFNFNIAVRIGLGRL